MLIIDNSRAVGVAHIVVGMWYQQDLADGRHALRTSGVETLSCQIQPSAAPPGNPFIPAHQHRHPAATFGTCVAFRRSTGPAWYRFHICPDPWIGSRVDPRTPPKGPPDEKDESGPRSRGRCPGTGRHDRMQWK